MGNAICQPVTDSKRYRSKSKEEAGAHKLITKLFQQESPAKENRKSLQIYNRVLDMMRDKLPREVIGEYLVANHELWQSANERLLTLEVIKDWLLEHPQSFDMLMKDMHMESTVKWIQLKQDLMEKSKQHPSNSRHPSLANLPQSLQTNGSVFRSNAITNTTLSRPSSVVHVYPKDSMLSSFGNQIDTKSKSSLKTSTHTQGGGVVSKSNTDFSLKSSSPLISGRTPRSQTQSSTVPTNPEVLLAGACKRLLEASLSGPDSVMEEILLQLWQISNASNVIFFHASDSKLLFDWRIIVSSVGSQDEVCSWGISSQDTELPYVGVIGDAWTRKEAVRTNIKDVRFNSQVDSGAVMKDFYLNALPISSVPEYQGVIVIYHPEEESGAEHHALLSHLLSVGLKTLETSIQNMKRSLEHKMTEILLDASHQLSKITCLPDVHKMIEQCARHILDCDVAMFIPFDKDKEYESDMRQVISRKTTVIVSSKSGAKEDKRAMLLPVEVDEEMYGIILLTRKLADFQEFDANVAQKLSSWIGDFLSAKNVQELVFHERVQECFTNPKLNSIVGCLRDFIKKRISSSQIVFYVSKHLVPTATVALLEKSEIFSLEEQPRGIITWAAESGESQMDSKAVPRSYYGETRSNKDDILVVPLRFGGRIIGVISCSRPDAPFTAREQRHLEQIISASSIGLRQAFIQDYEERIFRRQRLALEILCTDNDQSFIERSLRALNSESVGNTSSSMLRNTEESNGSTSSSEVSKTRALSLIGSVIMKLNVAYKMNLNTDAITKFVGQLSSANRKDVQIITISNNVQFLQLLLQQFQLIEIAWIKPTEALAIMLALMFCDVTLVKGFFVALRKQGSNGSVENSSAAIDITKVSYTSSITSLRESVENRRATQLVRYFYRQDANIFSNIDETTYKTILSQLRDHCNLEIKARTADLIKSLDLIINAFNTEQGKFSDYFDPKNDGSHRKILANLLMVCAWHSIFAQPWNNAVKWIQYSIRRVGTAEMDMATQLRQNLNRELATMDTVVAPCFELLKFIMSQMQTSSKVAEECFDQIMDNRKRLEDIIQEDSVVIDGSLESFFAEELFSSDNIV